MKTNRKHFVQGVTLLSLFAFLGAGCGKRSENSQNSSEISSAIYSGSPTGLQLDQILRSRPCLGGVPHAGKAWRINKNSGATSVLSGLINIDQPSVITAIGGVDMMATAQLNQYYNYGYYQGFQNSVVVVKDYGDSMDVATFMCGLASYDPYSNVSINNQITGGQWLPLLSWQYIDGQQRIVYDTSNNNCTFAQVAAFNFLFTVNNNVNNPGNPSGSSISIGFSTIDLTGNGGGTCI